MNQTRISAKEITEYDRFYRANLINSLTGFKSLNLIGTKSEHGIENLAVFSQVFHLGAHPPLVGIIVRPDSVPRHTLQNMRATQFFTLNHVLPSFIDKAHQTAANYPEEVSEFSEISLTTEYVNGFYAPFVKESNVKMALKFVYEHRIPLNNTLLIAGEIQDVFLPKEIIKTDGFVDLHEAKSCTVSGLDAYYSTQKLKRFSYPKPNQDLQELSTDLF